jgi:putative transposase
MHTPPATNHYKNHRFPVEIISHAVWLNFRFCLSFRDVEELLLERGVVVTYEAIRKWCCKFGQQSANQLRRQRPRPGDKWQMDEVFLTITGERHSLGRAVDQDGNVLDILVHRRRDKRAKVSMTTFSGNPWAGPRVLSVHCAACTDFSLGEGFFAQGWGAVALPDTKALAAYLTATPRKAPCGRSTRGVGSTA